MTRTHAAKQLLRLGPLCLAEFIEITGWSKCAAKNALRWLVETGELAYRGNTQHGIYEVSE